MFEFGQAHSAIREFRTSDVCGNFHSFEKLQLKDWLNKSLSKNGYKWQSRVQEATLPAALTGNDIIIQVEMSARQLSLLSNSGRNFCTKYGPKIFFFETTIFILF